MITKAELLADSIGNPYLGFGHECNQIAAMLRVQDTLLQQVQAVLRDLVEHTNQSTAKARAQILIKAITDNNYPQGSVLDIRPVLIAMKELV